MQVGILQKILKLNKDVKVYTSAWSAAPEFKSQNFSCSQTKTIIECTPNDGPPQIDCIRVVGNPTTCVGQKQGQPCNTTCFGTPGLTGGECNNVYEDGFPVSNTLDKKLYTPENVPSKNANGNCYYAGFIREDAYAAWAKQYAMFFEAYENASVPMWGVTVQVHTPPATYVSLIQLLSHVKACILACGPAAL